MVIWVLCSYSYSDNHPLWTYSSREPLELFYLPNVQQLVCPTLLSRILKGLQIFLTLGGSISLRQPRSTEDFQVHRKVSFLDYEFLQHEILLPDDLSSVGISARESLLWTQPVRSPRLYNVSYSLFSSVLFILEYDFTTNIMCLNREVARVALLRSCTT